MNQLSGKVALVTGGSRGIGAATARRLAREGAAVALTYVTAADKAQAVAKQIDADGSRVLVIQAGFHPRDNGLLSGTSARHVFGRAGCDLHR